MNEESEFERRNKLIGDRIKELRRSAGADKPERFAFEHDIPRVSYWRAEEGKTNLTLRLLYKICEAHNLSLAEFFAPLKETLKKLDE